MTAASDEQAQEGILGMPEEKHTFAEIEANAQDYTTQAVPLHERKDPVTMGLLWITMVTGFPSVLVGFDWYRCGLSINQVILCSLLSCGMLMLYCLPSCLLGAKSGLTYALLSRKVFGAWGSWFVSMNMVWVCIAWYGLTAVFLGAGLRGLYPQITVHPVIFSVILAVLMAFNNFFGFSGVANFARYLAGPMLLVWVLFTFWKAQTTCPVAVWQMPSQVPTTQALTLVSSFLIGYSVWGNEADYWRFARPSKRHILPPLLASLTIGALIFPATGWMLAYMTKITDYAGATSLMNSYAFGGISLVAAAVLIISYVAVNDSSLYGAINALENIAPFPRQRVTAFLALTGSITAGILCGMTKSFEDVASLSCVVLPSATVIIVTELLLLGRKSDLTYVPPLHDLPKFRWSAVSALIFGCGFGIVTAGIIPGTEGFHVGVPALQAWAISLVLYVIFRRFDRA